MVIPCPESIKCSNSCLNQLQKLHQHLALEAGINEHPACVFLECHTCGHRVYEESGDKRRGLEWSGFKKEISENSLKDLILHHSLYQADKVCVLPESWNSTAKSEKKHDMVLYEMAFLTLSAVDRIFLSK